MTKLSHDYVCKQFALQGYKLLDIYIDAKTPMKYICNYGHESKINWSNFNNGRRCKQCSHQKLRKERQHSLEYVQNYFAENECKLLSKTYVNAKILLDYQCKCGTIDKINFGNFTQGRRCRKCRLTKISGPNNYLWNPDREEIKRRALFRKRCYNILWNTLASTGTRKETKSEVLLGYDYKQLREHIETGWPWTKTRKGWEIDHIFPISAFVDYGISNLKIINCLENLRPLTRKANRKKRAIYNKSLFEQWLKQKGIETPI